MAQDPDAPAADAPEESSGYSWRAMVQAAKDKKDELADKMDSLDKDTTDISKLMEMALVELGRYEKKLNDLADNTEGKINLLSQFAKAKGCIYIHSIKVGIGLIGGSYGRGVLLVKSDAGWSLPLGVSKPEVKIGPQAGAIEEDSIILLKSEDSVKSFVTGKTPSITVGIDAFIAYDDKGSNINTDNTSIGTSAQKGYGGGATVDFGTFNDFTEANELFYGKNYDVSRILNVSPDMDSDIVTNLGNKLDTTKKFIQTLEGFAVAAQDEMAKQLPES